jgi:nucleotide-binding universal stress UspA family protein
VYHNILDDQESKARKVFDAAIAQNSATTSWRSIIGGLSYELASQARYSDLLILGQPDPSEVISLNDGVADEIILSAGRPCLLVPYHSGTFSVGESPLIAWDGSAEASRAIHDALPLLTRAGKATILIIEPEGLDTSFGDLPGTMISEHLAHHGINVKLEVSRGSSQSTGDTIMTYADAYGHDLIVMGAYGHSRMREIVLGGATRTMMKEMKVPVLMSH